MWSTFPVATDNNLNKAYNTCDLQVYEDAADQLKISSESIQSTVLKVKLYDLGGKMIANEIVQFSNGVGTINKRGLTTAEVYVIEYSTKECFGAVKLLKR